MLKFLFFLIPILDLIFLIPILDPIFLIPTPDLSSFLFKSILFRTIPVIIFFEIFFSKLLLNERGEVFL